MMAGSRRGPVWARYAERRVTIGGLFETGTDAIAIFRREFELCRVEEGGTVAIFSEGGRAAYAEAFAVAARELAASVVHIDLPLETGRDISELGGRPPGVGLASQPLAVEAFEAADVPTAA